MVAALALLVERVGGVGLQLRRNVGAQHASQTEMFSQAGEISLDDNFSLRRGDGLGLADDRLSERTAQSAGGFEVSRLQCALKSLMEGLSWGI